MNKFVLSAAAAICSFSLNAEQAFIAPLADKSVLLDIAGKDYVVVVGERGHILRSDTGERFAQVPAPTQATLTAVTTMGQNVWAVGHDAIILHSKDAGASWSVQHLQPEWERPLLDVLFFDENHGIAIGSYGLFLRTTDGGKSWASEQHITLVSEEDRLYLEDIKREDESFYEQELGSILPHFNRVSLHGAQLFIAGESGLLATSVDFGQTWQRYEVDYNGSFFDVVALNEQSMLAVGLRGNMFLFHPDSGWQSVASCATSTLNSALVVDEKHLVAMGNNGTLVNFSLPALLSSDTWDESVCGANDKVQVTQLSTKVAVLNAITINDKTLAVTAEGLQQLAIK